MKKTEDLEVFISTSDRDSSCCECGEALGRGAWITLVEGKGALCLACADLDHLIFLPSGNTALSRRARKHSILSAVVLINRQISFVSGKLIPAQVQANL